MIKIFTEPDSEKLILTILLHFPLFATRCLGKLQILKKYITHRHC